MSSPKTNPDNFLFYLLILLLPTQLGKHFWPAASYVLGVRVDYLSPTLYLTDIVLFLLILVYLPKAGLFQRIAGFKKYIFLVLALILLGITFSAYPLSGAYSLFKLSEFSILFLFITDHYGKIKKFIAPALALGIIFESLLAIAQFLNGGSIGGFFYLFGERFFSSVTPNIASAQIGGELVLRPYATFPHPNVLAAYILIGSFFILKEFNFRKTFQSISYAVALALGSVAIALTLSRTAILLYVLSLVVFTIRKKKINPKMFILLVPLLILWREISTRYQNLFTIDQSVSERLDLSLASIQMFFDRPFTGVGLGNFLHTLPYYYSSDSFFFLQPVHNIFLLAGSEAGLLGLASMVAIFTLLFRRASGINLVLAFIVLSLSLTDHFFLTLQQGQLLFVLVLGYIMADKSRD